MNRIGFSTCCFPYSTEIESILRFCLDHEFDACELEINDKNFDPPRVKPSTMEWIKGLSSSGTVAFGIHSPGRFNFSDPDPEKRAKAEEEVNESLYLAAQLGAKTVVVHPGRVIGGFTRERWETALEQNISAIRRCALLARELGVSLSVENLCHEKDSVNPNIASFLEMCRAIDLSLVRVTLDTNHAALVDGLAESTAVVEEYVNHIHFSSNKGVKSDHCEPLLGVIDFYSIQPFLRNFTGLTIIELNEIGAESGGAILRTRSYLHDLQNAGNN